MSKGGDIWQWFWEGWRIYEWRRMRERDKEHVKEYAVWEEEKRSRVRWKERGVRESERAVQGDVRKRKSEKLRDGRLAVLNGQRSEIHV